FHFLCLAELFLTTTQRLLGLFHLADVAIGDDRADDVTLFAHGGAGAADREGAAVAAGEATLLQRADLTILQDGVNQRCLPDWRPAVPARARRHFQDVVVKLTDQLLAGPANHARG